MTQEPLFDVPATVTVTDRQQAVLDAVRQAGRDGLDNAEAGAILCHRNHKHGPTDRCQWCEPNGRGVMHELAAKGLARYRRARAGEPGAWVAALHAVETPPGMLPDDQPLPF